jgi:hypothetical protein
VNAVIEAVNVRQALLLNVGPPFVIVSLPNNQRAYIPVGNVRYIRVERDGL